MAPSQTRSSSWVPLGTYPSLCIFGFSQEVREPLPISQRGMLRPEPHCELPPPTHTPFSSNSEGTAPQHQGWLCPESGPQQATQLGPFESRPPNTTAKRVPVHPDPARPPRGRDPGSERKGVSSTGIPTTTASGPCWKPLAQSLHHPTQASQPVPSRVTLRTRSPSDPQEELTLVAPTWELGASLAYQSGSGHQPSECGFELGKVLEIGPRMIMITAIQANTY